MEFNSYWLIKLHIPNKQLQKLLQLLQDMEALKEILKLQ